MARPPAGTMPVAEAPVAHALLWPDEKQASRELRSAYWTLQPDELRS